MTLKTELVAKLTATQTGTQDIGAKESFVQRALALTFGDGAGAMQASKVFSDERAIAASANEDLDLAGVLTDAFGASITFATIKGVLIYSLDANANDVVIGNAATNQFVGWFGAATHTEAVRPAGWTYHAAPKTGWTVTPGTGDLLRVANGGGGTSITYGIIVIGT